MTFDVFKQDVAGVTSSLLVAPFVYTGGTTADFDVKPGAELNQGDLLFVNRIYVPGGGPTMRAHSVFVIFAGAPQLLG